jgi:hypothetical protein
MIWLRVTSCAQNLSEVTQRVARAGETTRALVSGPNGSRAAFQARCKALVPDSGYVTQFLDWQSLDDDIATCELQRSSSCKSAIFISARSKPVFNGLFPWIGMTVRSRRSDMMKM